MKLPGGADLTLWAFLKRLYREYENDAVSDTAAQLGYYFLFSLFPFIFFLAALTGYLPLQRPMDDLIERIRPMVPGPAMALIQDHLRGLVSHGRPRLATFALLGSIWSASRGVDAVRRALNLAYDVKESRPAWKTQAISVVMTLAGAMAVLVVVAALVAGGSAGFWLAGKIHIQHEFVWTMRWLRWPITALVIMSVAALVYYLLPDVEQSFRFITPGSVIATIFWMVATWGFGQYVSSFANYDVTYGSLGGVVVLLTWLYLAGFIFLMGGEINAVLEHASPEGKAPGARIPGAAPPPPEQRPSAMPPAAAKSADVADKAVAGETAKEAPV